MPAIQSMVNSVIALGSVANSVSVSLNSDFVISVCLLAVIAYMSITVFRFVAWLVLKCAKVVMLKLKKIKKLKK